MGYVKRFYEDCADNMAQTVCKVAGLERYARHIWWICHVWVFEAEGQDPRHKKVTWGANRQSAGIYKRYILGIVAEVAENPTILDYYREDPAEIPDNLAEIATACRTAQQKYLPKKATDKGFVIDLPQQTSEPQPQYKTYIQPIVYYGIIDNLCNEYYRQQDEKHKAKTNK